jgi:hypothetical protein
MILIEGLSHFLTNFLQNLASCQTSLNKNHSKIRVVIYATSEYSNTFFYERSECANPPSKKKIRY